MLNRFCFTPVLLFAALVIPSCVSDPAGESGTSASRTANPGGEPIRLTDVPPPPGVPPIALTPYDESQTAKADMSRQQAIATLAAPRYLDQLGQAPEPRDTTPPLAAQKFYAAGKQALLENDNFRAVQQLEKALRLSPGEPAILRSLAEAWTRAGNRVSASNFYRQAFAADPTDLDSVFMLGRFALDERRWDQAILNLDAALQLAAPNPEANDNANGETPASPRTADPVATHLIHYYLANALNQAGYGKAAAEMFDAYLAGRPRLSGISPYAREIAVLNNQRGETLMLAGDLQHRLNNPRAAWAAYAAAAENGVLNRSALHKRLIFTRLRLGQTRAAQELVAEAITESRGDAETLKLVPYAIAQGVSAEALSSQLTALYEERGRPASLALAIADVLPAEVATPLLQQHLEDQPGDDAVFGRLLAMLLGESPSLGALQQAVSATADAMAAEPGLADAYAERLLANVRQPASLLDAFPEPATATTLTLRGKVLLADGQRDAAAEAFAQALELDAQAELARLELSAVELDRGNVERAEALLEPLADSNDPRVTMLRVRALAETGQTEAALSLLNDVLRRTPPGSPLMLDKADLLLKLGRVEDAERTLLDALNARPTDEAIYEALLDIYNDNGNMIRNYQRLVRRMVDTIPDARITRLVKLETLVAMRQFPQAQALIATFEEPDEAGEDRLLLQRLRLEIFIGTDQAEAVESLIEQHLNETEAQGVKPSEEMLTLAVRYFARRNEALALRLETIRWEITAPSVQRSLTLGSLYYTQERYADAAQTARETFDQGFELTNEQTIQSIGLLLASLLKLERFTDAIAAVEQTFEVKLDDDQRMGLTFELIDRLFDAGLFEEAEQYVARFVAGHPDLGGDATMILAMQYEELGDTDTSRRVMEAALEDFPRHPGLNNSLGYGLANDGVRLNDAERMIARAVAAEPDEAAYLDSMGWVYYKKAEFERALKWLERSQAANGGVHPVIVDHIGDTLYRLGRPAEAVRSWNTARVLMSAEGYQSMDPEEETLPTRLNAKIQAVAEARPAPVADVGQGVEIPASEPPAEAEPAALAEPEIGAVEPALPAEVTAGE